MDRNYIYDALYGFVPRGIIDSERDWGDKDLIDFALEMVRQHNEECAKIAESYGEHTAGHYAIAQDIRKAKP